MFPCWKLHWLRLTEPRHQVAVRWKRLWEQKRRFQHVKIWRSKRVRPWGGNHWFYNQCLCSKIFKEHIPHTNRLNIFWRPADQIVSNSQHYGIDWTWLWPWETFEESAVCWAWPTESRRSKSKYQCKYLWPGHHETSAGAAGEGWKQLRDYGPLKALFWPCFPDFSEVFRPCPRFG